MRDALGAVGRTAAITRLLDLGAIQGSFLRVTDGHLSNADMQPEQLIEYRITGFGEALMRFAASGLNLSAIDPSGFS